MIAIGKAKYIFFKCDRLIKEKWLFHNHWRSLDFWANKYSRIWFLMSLRYEYFYLSSLCSYIIELTTGRFDCSISSRHSDPFFWRELMLRLLLPKIGREGCLYYRLRRERRYYFFLVCIFSDSSCPLSSIDGKWTLTDFDLAMAPFSFSFPSSLIN